MLSQVFKPLRRFATASLRGSLGFNRYDWLHHSHHVYMTAPIVAVCGVTLSAFGTFWALRSHFNPIQSRPFDEIMKANLIGQSLAGTIDLKLSPLNAAYQNEITEIRNDTIKKVRQRFQFQFLTGNIYLRPICLEAMDGIHNENEIDTMKLMREYGICHAFWILNAGPVDYILDFIREGIRLEMVENAHEVINSKENREIYIPYFEAPVALNISSYNLMDWICLQQQTHLNRPYDLNTNHCLHFVDEFGQHFKPETFHPDQRRSKFNTGIKQKSNEELLEWTKSIIHAQN
eukprot:168006_1